jgi:glutaredoxin
MTSPKPVQRSAEHQQQVEQALQSMTLYQLYACPFCIKTRRALRRLNLPLEIRNVNQGSPYRQELETGGGRIQVPCLKISDQGEDAWMYESSDIIHFLEQRFGTQS